MYIFSHFLFSANTHVFPDCFTVIFKFCRLLGKFGKPMSKSLGEKADFYVAMAGLDNNMQYSRFQEFFMKACNRTIMPVSKF